MVDGFSVAFAPSVQPVPVLTRAASEIVDPGGFVKIPRDGDEMAAGRRMRTRKAAKTGTAFGRRKGSRRTAKRITAVGKRMR